MPTRFLRSSVHSLLATLLLGFAASAEPATPAVAAPPRSTPHAGVAGESIERAERAASLREQSSLSGGTGLLHLQDPLASAVGTFRVSVLFDSYKGSGFLCNASTPCPGVQADMASHFGTTVGLSATLLPFLEGYASLDSFANSNDARTPSLISAVGNTTFGLKGFTPSPVLRLLRFGGVVEGGFLGSSGVVGVAGGGTSFRFIGLAQADFRGVEGGGIPLRARVNVGYFWDNSASLVNEVERDRGEPVTRIERFGLGVNRVDQTELGLGVDALFGVARPFVEWNVGIPVNRQGYTCYPARSFSGDGCLATDDTLSAFPSKLTLGARFFPWLPGLSATAAIDIGTSGTSDFIEELAPTMPWTLWLGAGYGVDVIPAPPVVIHDKPAQPAPTESKPTLVRARGWVHEAGKDAGIPKAIVSYEGRDLTGMVTGPDGHFTTAELEPGAYTLAIEAPGFERGQCSITLEHAAAPSDAPRDTQVDCPLTPLPPFGRLTGSVRDNQSSTPLAGVAAIVRDHLGRELAVTTDANGAFSFESIPPGSVTLLLKLDGYLFRAETIEIGTRADVRRDIGLRPRPARPRVTKTARELVLGQPIRFEENTGEPTTDSLAMLEEVADLLARTPELRHVEIQVHTDAGGNASQEEAATERRALALRDWLTSHGVDASRLAARGFGSSQPLSPNVTPAGRARNRRVRFVLTD